MPDIHNALSPQVIARLDTMQLRARAIVEGHFSGSHRSPFRGASVEFADHREYNPGDDTRDIDWRVYGRHERLFVKQYEAETNLNVHLLVDVSRSMHFGEPLPKLEYAACTAAALAYLAANQQDAPSLVLFDNAIRLHVPARTKSAQLQVVFDALDEIEVGEDTSIAKALGLVAQSLKRRGLIVLISDLLDEPDSVLRALSYFRHRGHDVMVLHLLDSAEMGLEFRGLTVFEDLETGQRVLAEPDQIRTEYQNALNGFLTQLRSGCRKQSIDYELIQTDRPFDSALAAYLGRRNRSI